VLTPVAHVLYIKSFVLTYCIDLKNEEMSDLIRLVKPLYKILVAGIATRDHFIDFYNERSTILLNIKIKRESNLVVIDS
jgi:hypothetical protein